MGLLGSKTTDAFTVTKYQSYMFDKGTYYGFEDRTITLNASRSSSIYGNSSTVQPKSLNLNILIKY